MGGWHAAWVWQLSCYISLCMQALITGRLDRFDRRQLTLWDSCLSGEESRLKSDKYSAAARVSLKPRFMSGQSITCRDNKLLCKGLFFPFQCFMTKWKSPAPDLLLSCPGPEIIGITSFRDSYNGNEHVAGLVSGTADLISASNKVQLPLKH